MNRRAPIFAAIGMVLLVLLVVFLAVLPKMQQVSDARDALAAAEAEETRLRGELERLQAVRAQLPEVRRRLARFNQKVPATADLPGLIRLLQNSADASNLVFFSIQPGTPTVVGGPAPGAPAVPTTPGVPAAPAGDASVIPADIVVHGGFFEIDQFLFRLETLPRAAKVVSITITTGAEDTILQAAIAIRVFTTDVEAGPGSAPEEPIPPADPGPPPTTAPTTAPGVSPSPTATPEG